MRVWLGCVRVYVFGGLWVMLAQHIVMHLLGLLNVFQIFFISLCFSLPCPCCHSTIVSSTGEKSYIESTAFNTCRCYIHYRWSNFRMDGTFKTEFFCRFISLPHAHYFYRFIFDMWWERWPLGNSNRSKCPFHFYVDLDIYFIYH